MKKIAIIVFVPSQPHLIRQFFGLYYSVMLHPQVVAKVDFLIGCSPDITHLFVRPNCRVTHTREISREPEFQFPKMDNGENGYINSWSHFIDETSLQAIAEYPYALRIDVDTFITPNILNIEIADDEILTGHGGYIGGQETIDNLLRVANTLGMKHRGEHGIGSTWYSRSSNIIDVCKAALSCAAHFFHKEFSERGEWPKWFAPVATMYAGELALNDSDFTITKTRKLDAHSTQEESINSVYTIHCWHTSDYFSKHQYMVGKYNDLPSPSTIDRCNDYAFFCARSGQLLEHAVQSGEVVEDDLRFTPFQAIKVATNLLVSALSMKPADIYARVRRRWHW